MPTVRSTSDHRPRGKGVLRALGLIIIGTARAECPEGADLVARV